MELPESPKVQRLSIRGIAEQILEILNLERGLGYSFKMLAFDPKGAIREYLFDNRQRHMKPFQFLLFTVAIATFISILVLPKPEELLQQLQQAPEWANMSAGLQVALTWLTLHLHQYFNIIYLIGLPFTSLASYLIFRSAQLNYAEHLVINAYILGFQTIFYIFIIPLLLHYQWVGFIQIALTFGYTIYAYKSVFEVSWPKGMLKTIFVFIVAQALMAMFYGLALGVFVVVY
ncbi:MAG: hypothetical protein DHS20C18_51630 [Saprospiraceae bacterium]|nr:MAG: hypothetical protein DHS20C18_51630 [Saprospiraceae bacterium]